MLSHEKFNTARANLSAFVLDQAAIIQNATGLYYEGAENAPNSYDEVLKEFNQAGQNGGRIRVYSGSCENTIYTAAPVNLAFRFWHDYLHFKNKFDFSRTGEELTALIHCGQVAARFGLGSVEYLLMQVDTFGQVAHFWDVGGFVDNQLNFAAQKLNVKNSTLN